MALGDFINRVTVQVAAQRMWADGRNNRELIQPIVSAKTVLDNQRVTFVPIMQGSVCIGVQAIWLKSCNDTVLDCEDSGNDLSDCDVSGIEAEGTSKTYQPNVCLTKSLKVTEDDCAGFNSFEEKLAFKKLETKAKIEREFNKKVIASIVANAQVNSFPQGGTVAGTTVGFAAALWADGEGAKLLPKIHISAEKGQIYDAYMLNGENFYESKWLYEFKEKAGSAERYDDAYSRGPWPMSWDIIDLDTVAASPSSFLLDRSSLAFFGQNVYDNLAPQQLVSDKFVYKEPSNQLMYRNGQGSQQVYFDVVEDWNCTVGSTVVKNRRYRSVDIEYTLRGGLITGPTDCGGKVGILHYNQI